MAEKQPLKSSSSANELKCERCHRIVKSTGGLKKHQKVCFKEANKTEINAALNRENSTFSNQDTQPKPPKPPEVPEAPSDPSVSTVFEGDEKIQSQKYIWRKG